MSSYRQARVALGLKSGFPGTVQYWENRYAVGGDSGGGSRGRLARFKADFVNDFVESKGVDSVIEFGCGDGQQVRLSNYPAYLGLDVSKNAVRLCRQLFPGDKTKEFQLLAHYDGRVAELALSMDVLYHLVRDDEFETHLRALFKASSRFVIIYARDSPGENNEVPGRHIRYRRFTDWIDQHIDGWTLTMHVPNPYPYQGDDASGSHSEFFIYSSAVRRAGG